MNLKQLLLAITVIFMIAYIVSIYPFTEFPETAEYHVIEDGDTILYTAFDNANYTLLHTYFRLTVNDSSQLLSIKDCNTGITIFQTDLIHSVFDVTATGYDITFRSNASLLITITY